MPLGVTDHPPELVMFLATLAIPAVKLAAVPVKPVPGPENCVVAVNVVPWYALEVLRALAVVAVVAVVALATVPVTLAPVMFVKLAPETAPKDPDQVPDVTVPTVFKFAKDVNDVLLDAVILAAVPVVF